MSETHEATTAGVRSARFRAEREAGWKVLEQLVEQVEKHGIRSLGFRQASDLATHYRQAANSLSVAREISLDRSLLAYLEALTARAYLAVYAPPENLGGLGRRFLTVGAPAAVRSSAGWILLGFLAMALGGVTGYALFFENVAWFDVIVGQASDDIRGPSATREELLSIIYSEDVNVIDQLGAFASFLFSNNVRVAIFAFALGAFLCLPTFLLVFYNGMMLGAFMALHVDRGIGLDLFGWLSIHGVTELSAICLSAGAGFRLGGAILFPGRRTRRDALHEESRDAVKVALVAALMLVAAALLEGFGRQLITSLEARVIIGWSVGALWLAWFASGRRRR